MCETWLYNDSECTTLFPDYKVFSYFRPKTHKKGRYSGGVTVLVKNDIAKGVKRVYNEYHDMIFLLLDCKYFGIAKNILLGFIYIPPENSSVYNYQNYDPWSEIEEVIAKCNNDLNEPDVLFIGDMNARTGIESDFIENDTNMFIPVPENYNADNVMPRNSKDKIVNNFGRKLLDFCKATGMRILNGRTEGDKEGNFTYVSHMGKSVVDYAISTIHSLYLFMSFTVGVNPESDHLPVTVNLKINKSDLNSTVTGDTSVDTFNPLKYIWNDRHKDSFIRKVQTMIKTVSEVVRYDDINECVSGIYNYFMRQVKR